MAAGVQVHIDILRQDCRSNRVMHPNDLSLRAVVTMAVGEGPGNGRVPRTEGSELVGRADDLTFARVGGGGSGRKVRRTLANHIRKTSGIRHWRGEILNCQRCDGAGGGAVIVGYHYVVIASIGKSDMIES